MSGTVFTIASTEANGKDVRIYVVRTWKLGSRTYQATNESHAMHKVLLAMTRAIERFVPETRVTPETSPSPAKCCKWIFIVVDFIPTKSLQYQVVYDTKLADNRLLYIYSAGNDSEKLKKYVNLQV